MEEIEIKLERIRALLDKHHLDGLLLKKVSSFAWATCGAASFVNTASTDGAASLLITRTSQYVLTDNIESTRIKGEEMLEDQGWKIITRQWYGNPADLASLAGGNQIGCDGPIPDGVDLSGEISRMRALLISEENLRFRTLGRLCAETMNTAARLITPGMSEYQIAALIAGGALSREVQPIVNLIATDDRIFSYRHPLPTSKRLEKYGMLVMCGRHKGLVCSITRLVYFGRLPEELLRKSHAVARVDAEMILQTRPGKSLGDIIETARNVYSQTGFADEWMDHHQGGPAGYEPREYLAVPGSDDLISIGQVYAWNPSIRGTKSEDTILVGDDENEIITEIPDWPMIPIEYDGKKLMRPAILEIT